MYQYAFDIHFPNENPLQRDIDLFKDREVKAKSIFRIELVSKPTAYEFVRKYHYLADAKFFSMYAFGLFHIATNELIGVATFSTPQGNVALKGWFGLGNDCRNILELSRLCVLPHLNGTNASSFLLGGSIKALGRMNEESRQRKKKIGEQFSDNDWVCRAVITLASSDRHVGSIYQVCNFSYYGLTDAKNDFYSFEGDGSYRKNPRGETKDLRGVWMQRPRKHRYAYILDPSLKINYDRVEHFPTKGSTEGVECCGGTHIVYDRRFGESYTCPICTGKLERI